MNRVNNFIGTLLIILPFAMPLPAQWSQADLQALDLIASREGLARLDFNDSKAQWRVVDSSWSSSISRFVGSKSRLDIITPLEALTERLEQGLSAQSRMDAQTFHSLRRAYLSLSSLYSYYKINALSDTTKQTNFIARFATILTRVKAIITAIEQNTLIARRYFATPNSLEALNESLVDLGNNNTVIDRALTFYPNEMSDAKKMVIFLVHGTFAKGSAEYQSDKHILFQQTKYMAQTLANDRKSTVELYSFGWSGANNNEDRMIAGEELANFVLSFFPPEEYEDVYIGHSHGGNVILHMAKTLREYRTPHTVVTLATPIRKDFITDNLNYLFEFYSESDWVQYIGSYELSSRNGTTTDTYVQSARTLFRHDIEKLGLFEHNNRYNKVKIYATQVLINNEQLEGRIQSHVNMKYLIGALPQILKRLLGFNANSHWSLNLALDEKGEFTIDQGEHLAFDITPLFAWPLA